MIGIFDSGVGGLSVWRELYKVLPKEKYLYFSDAGYCPYGPKSREEIIARVRVIADFLIENGAEIIVVACNTATAAAIEFLRGNYGIPFVGMEPAVKPAAINTRTGAIGVLATRGTFKGELYLRTLHKFASNAKVLEQVGEGLVELVENGEEMILPQEIQNAVYSYEDENIRFEIAELLSDGQSITATAVYTAFNDDAREWLENQNMRRGKTGAVSSVPDLISIMDEIVVIISR